MDRAGTDNDEEAFVVAEDDLVDFLARLSDEVGLGFRFWVLGDELGRGGKGFGASDVYVGGFFHGGPSWWSGGQISNANCSICGGGEWSGGGNGWIAWRGAFWRFV